MKARELFRASAYRDGAASNGDPRYSIGYGHQIQFNEQSLMSGTITKAKADLLFASDLSPLENQINRGLAPTVKVNQNQFDALIDFGFNCGSSPLSKVLTTINGNPHNLKAATDQMQLYNKTHNNRTNALVYSQELANRRLEEVHLFDTPIPTAAKTGVFIAVALGVGFLLCC